MLRSEEVAVAGVAVLSEMGEINENSCGGCGNPVFQAEGVPTGEVFFSPKEGSIFLKIMHFLARFLTHS